VQVQEIPGLGHLPYAEVWLHGVDEARWREASSAARGIGKTGLEVWTTTKTQEVADFFVSRGYEEVRRYAISELDVASARDLGAPEFEIVSFADRPELADELYAIACTAYHRRSALPHPSGQNSGRGPVIQPASNEISTAPHSRIAQVKTQ